MLVCFISDNVILSVFIENIINIENCLSKYRKLRGIAGM